MAMVLGCRMARSWLGSQRGTKKMPVAELLISPQQQFVDASGVPYAFGSLYTYIEDTFTPKNTWQDRFQMTLNSNPIILDNRGTCIVFGTGTYRFILNDQDGNQIFDAVSDEPLPASAVSDAMLPVLGALTLAQARSLMGIDQEIQDAIGEINLMTGPTGPTGPTGQQGVTGPTGSTGAAGTVDFSMTNPGYILFGTYGLAPLINFGFNASDSTGHATITFAKPFTSSCAGVTGTCVAPEGIWMNPTGTSNGGFTAITMTPYAPGSTFFGPVGFFWIAIGQ